ncbi:MAG: SDR family NAD(P)-dependent oxidoreductase [Chloroflexota bacterium]|nr:SDR family NAD(P)-dependent oxidoreductase [Chloroflexota bacterium]
MTEQGKRVAVVTGAGRGLGREIARYLARNGWALVVNDNGAEIDGSGGDAGVAEAVAGEIRAAGGQAAASADTVGSWETGERLAALANERFGPVDLLVNNAAILRDRMSFKMSADEWQTVIEQNLSGAFYCCRAVLPEMRERRSGSIVNIISTTAIYGNSSQVNYASSKGGLLTMSRVLAQDMYKYGVTVNAVAPFGHTRDTERIVALTPEVQQYFEGAMTVPAEDVAPLVAFLASDAGKKITGQVLGVRGKEVFLFSQPRPIRSAVKSSGWDVDGLTRVFETWEAALAGMETDLEVFKYRPFV